MDCKIIPFPNKRQNIVYENIDPQCLQALLDSLDYYEYFPVGKPHVHTCTGFCYAVAL